MTSFALLIFLIALAYVFISTGPATRARTKAKSPGSWWHRFRTSGTPKTGASTRTKQGASSSGKTSTKVLPIDKGDMLRCHHCGCFFPERLVHTKVVEGHILHFCSSNCKDNFKYP